MAEEKVPPAENTADDAATAEQLASVLADDPESQEDTFGAAFEGFAAPKQEEEPQAGEPAAVDDDKDEPATPDDQPSDDATEGEAAPDEGAAEKDIWANATPEQKAAIEAATHENESHRTRASAQNRKINELMSAAQPAAEDTDAPIDMDTDADWKQFEEDYPEVEAPVKKLIGGLVGEIKSLQNQVAGITDDRRSDAINAQEALLGQRHPDWEQVTASEDFAAWLPEQPRYVQEGFARNGNAITDGQEAASLIDLFKVSKPSNVAKPAPKDKETNGMDSRRKRRMDSAVTTESGQAGPGSGPPEGDFDTAFDHFVKHPQPNA